MQGAEETEEGAVCVGSPSLVLGSRASGVAALTKLPVTELSRWLRGLDLDQRPLGYKDVPEIQGPLILCDSTQTPAGRVSSQVFPKTKKVLRRKKAAPEGTALEKPMT